MGSVSTRARDPADSGATPGGHRDAGTESKSKSRRFCAPLRAAGVEVIGSRATSLRPSVRLWRAEVSGAEKQNAFTR